MEEERVRRIVVGFGIGWLVGYLAGYVRSTRPLVAADDFKRGRSEWAAERHPRDQRAEFRAAWPYTTEGLTLTADPWDLPRADREKLMAEIRRRLDPDA